MTDSLVYIADHKGLVMALNRHNGDTKSEVETKLPLSAGAGLSEHSLVFASSLGDVIALVNRNGVNAMDSKGF